MSFLPDFLSVKKTAVDAAARLKELNDKGNSIRYQLAAIRDAMPAKEDVEAAISTWVEDIAADFTGAVQSSLLEIIQSPREVANPRSFSNLFASGIGESLGIGGSSDRADKSQRAASQLRVLCALFGPQVKVALLSAVASMSWPEGLPVAARPAALDRLNGELDKINEEVSALRAAAAEAGLQLK